MLSLKNLLMAALLIFAVSIVGKAEAGIVTDKIPLQCYVDHKVTSYDLNSGQAVGWIDAEVDLVQIEEIGGNGVARGTHPGRNGTVRRLFWARDVFADTNYANRPAHVNGYHEVYRTSSSGSTIGSVRDEDVTVVADNGNRAQIVYRLDNGTGYKMGWVPSSVVPPTPGPTPSNFQMESYNLTCPADHQLRFTGRLWNANNYSEITGVHVYIGGGVGAGGDFIGEFRADRDNHSFDSVINVPQNRNGNQLVVIYAVNGIDAKELDRRNINVSGESATGVNDKLQNLINRWKGQSWNPYGSGPDSYWPNGEKAVGWQCFGFGNYIFKQLHGVICGRKVGNSHIVSELSDGVYQTFTTTNATQNTIHNALQNNISPGDLIQGTNGRQHTMIFVSYDANSRILYLFDANFANPPDNIIRYRQMKLQNFVNRFPSVSFYTR